MKPSRAADGGQLGRKLLLLLLAATWAPLVLLLWTSLGAFESRLVIESSGRLADQVKASGLEIFRRLEYLHADMEVLETGLAPPRGAVDLLSTKEKWRDRFAILVATAGQDSAEGGLLPRLDSGARARLRERRTTLVVAGTAREGYSVWLISPLKASSSALIWARVRLDWLWPESAEEHPDGTEWLLFGPDRGWPIATSPGPPAGVLDHLDELAESARAGFEWRDRSGELFLAQYWTLPLGFDFGYPGFTVLASERYRLGASIGALRRYLFLVALGALLLIALVGIRRLRSDLGPLERLAEGARFIADGDLSTRVKVTGSDELGRLSGAFNEMAEELESRFHQMQGIRNIGASALVLAPDAEVLARVFVEQAALLAGDSEVVIALLDDAGAIRRSFSTAQRPGSARNDEYFSRLVPWAALRSGEEWVEGKSDSAWRALRRGELTMAVVGIVGALRGGRRDRLALLRGSCDQLALALTRVRLLEDLDRANWGALTALARAVDTKSRWTHGHSIRVAEIAVALASEVGFSDEEVRRIRRGCLVHDVGKIGVPSAVLDKPGPLTGEEMAILHSHVELGVRILEPVEGLAEVLPIVWQHHERLDGSGYPKQLRGKEIAPAAALVAVADIFEAVTVARPYRAAWEPEKAVAHLRSLAGTELNPEYVDALCRIRVRCRSWVVSDDPKSWTGDGTWRGLPASWGSGLQKDPDAPDR